MAKYSHELIKTYFEWDIKSWSRALEKWEQVLPENADGKAALEVGARRGGLSLFLAQKGYQVICSDIESPEQSARPLHEKFGMANQLTYKAADAAQLPFADESFDAVVFKSLLGSVGRDGQIDLQKQAISEFHRVLRPGGYMLFAENLIATSAHMYLRRRFNRWGGYCQYVNLGVFKESLRIFTSFEYATFGFVATLGRTEGQRSLLYHFDAVLDRCLPETWKYLVYGYARK